MGKSLLFATAFAVVSLASPAYEWSEGGEGPAYQFGTPAAPLETGSVAVPTDQSADSITTVVSNDSTVTFSGGSLSLSDGGFLRAGGVGTVAFVTPIETAGAVTLDDANTQTTGDLYPTDTNAKTVLEKASIDNFDIFSGYLKSSYMDKDAPAYNVVRGDGTLDVQLQIVDGSWLKCAKLNVEDKDGDIVVKIEYSRYVEVLYYSLGSDFDAIPVGNVVGTARKYDIVTGGTGNGCGLKNLTIGRRDSVFGMKMSGSFAPGGTVTVEKGANVRMEDATPSGSDIFSAPLALKGRLSVADRESLSFSGVLSGQGGKMILEPWSSAPAVGKTIQVGDKDVVQPISSTVLTGVKLYSISNITDVYILPYSGAKSVVKAVVCQFSNNGRELKFQAQYFGKGEKIVKAACVTMTQSGANVAASYITPYVYFASDVEAELFLGSDMYSVQSSWTSTSGGYSPTAMTVLLDETVTERHEVLLAGAGNAQESGTIDVGSGRRLVLNAANSAPDSGTVVVRDGGELEARIASAAKKESCVLNVLRGGILRQTANDVFDNWGPTFQIDGGEIALNRGNMAEAVPDCGAYLNLVTLAGGSRVTGRRARIGSNSTSRSPVWKVTGGDSTEPVRISSGFNFVGQGVKMSFCVNVDDFAEGADLIQEPGERIVDGDAQFGDWSSSASNTMPLKKGGEGTWQIGSVSSNYHGTVNITAGEIAFSVSEALPNSEGLVLSGGKLTAMAGTTQTVVWKSFTAASSLAIGDGASLAFTSVPAGDWDFRLTVTGDVAETSLKMPALADGQLKRIRINGRHAAQDTDGYLHPLVLGTQLIIR